jgi:hypothetical protein
MVILGFLIVFIIAYLIKSRNPEMLGALLLLSFFCYVLAGKVTVFAE